MKRRVLFLSGREAIYIRNRVLLSALRTRFDVTVLTPDVPSTSGRVLIGLARFLARRPDYDVILAGFFGQPIALCLSKLQSKPVILDAYVSIFDTLCNDRRWFDASSLGGRMAYWLDSRSCRLAAYVLTDTEAHASYFAKTFGLPESKLVPVYVGCDEAVFYPREEMTIRRKPLEIFFYGAFLPLHGTDIIIQAAQRLRSRADIHFTIGGDGMCRKAVQRTVTELAMPNLDLIGWIPFEELPNYIARADICLGGHFSKVSKAARVISTKTFQFLAMRKPTIVADNPATREILTHGEHAWAIPMGSANALAEAIQTLADDPALRSRLADGGYRIFSHRLTTQTIAERLASLVEEAACESAS